MDDVEGPLIAARLAENTKKTRNRWPTKVAEHNARHSQYESLV
jgi:hypothetical protein